MGIEPPAGYTLFATHAENGWDFWVPPDYAVIKTRLQRYQFINQDDQIGEFGPVPCVSVGNAMPEPDKSYSVYTWDIENDFSRYGTCPTRPYIPQFIAMSCSYVTAIGPPYGWTQITIGLVTRPELGDFLCTLGFTEAQPGTYVGIMAGIDPRGEGEVRTGGLGVAPTTTASTSGVRTSAVESVSQ